MTVGTCCVRAPASSANLGPGFDVLGMAVTLHADVGVGEAPAGARRLDEHHPANAAFEATGGSGPLWLRSSIPMARGLGFSGAVRVAAAALGVAVGADDPTAAISAREGEILRVTAALEGHGDNVAASLHGGITAYVDGRLLSLRLGPVLSSAAFIAWIPDVTTSTDRSRRGLAPQVARADAVHNIAHAIALSLAVEHDDPTLLVGATADRLHQAARLPDVPGAAAALDAGVAAGAWCGWLSGSGPTVGFLCDASIADEVAAALPGEAHTKVLGIDRRGAHVV